jgi:hypothetical protein
MASQGSAAAPGPETEKKRRLTEADLDPSGDSSSSNNSGETESVGNNNRTDNQPAENHEDPSLDRDTGHGDSENAPKPGQEQ